MAWPEIEHPRFVREPIRRSDSDLTMSKERDAKHEEDEGDKRGGRGLRPRHVSAVEGG
jgi:hypothetical protein